MTERERRFLRALSTAASLAVPALAAAQDGAHPLVGTWTWTRGSNACTEMYEFRPDGTAGVVSGDERTDNTYTVSSRPDARGFHKLVLTVTRDHGGKDCADQDRDDTGQQNTGYVRFEPDMNSLVWCRKPNMETCFGPLRRKAPR